MEGKLGCRKGLVLCSLCSLWTVQEARTAVQAWEEHRGGHSAGPLPALAESYHQQSLPHLPHKATPRPSLHSLPKRTILSSLPCPMFPGASLVSDPVSTLPEDRLALTLSHSLRLPAVLKPNRPCQALGLSVDPKTQNRRPPG